METPEDATVLRDNLRLRQLIISLKGGVLVEDETRHISLVNQAFCDMFGIPAPPESLIGTDCSGSAEASKSLFVDPDAFVHRINEILAQREAVIGETLHLVDGRVFARDYMPVFDPSKYIGHLWHYRDITAETKLHQRLERLLHFEEVNKEVNRLFLQWDDTDAALNQSLKITGTLLDVSRVYMFRFREHERKLDNTHEWCAPGVRPEMENLKGLPFDELLPSFFPMIAEHDLIAPHHISELPDDLRGILEAQDIQTVLWMPMYLNHRIEGFLGYDETRHPRHWLPEEVSLARIVMESYSRALERDKSTQMLVKAREEALRTAQLRAQFVANMSHEIRTPLTGIMGMLELLLETDLEDIQLDFANEAFKSSTNLLEIINDVLDFSKLDAGQIILEANAIDIRAIATEVKMTLAPQVKSKPVELELTLDPEIPYRVYGDATRIRQVMYNLVGNAVKFTHRGRVAITIKVVRFVDDTVYLRFSVEDTGIGIAREHLTHIFDSFVQADGTTTRQFGGTGLGLSISRQLVELMGGAIKAESTLGEGSVFTFLLRLPVTQQTKYDDTKVNFSALHVLLIDPNRTGRYVLRQQLANWGVSVTQLESLDDLKSLDEDTAYDIAMCRYDETRREAEVVKLLACARQIYYLCHKSDLKTFQETDVACLETPIAQSTLYSLLTEAVDRNRSGGDIVRNIEEKRILIAEDLDMNVEVVVRALANLPVRVDHVGDGLAVLDRLKHTTYDLILMDIQMPNMDGIQATKQIRQSDAAYSDIPILALTASVMDDDKEKYFEAGINEVITKPFKVRDLRDIVSKWL